MVCFKVVLLVLSFVIGCLAMEEEVIQPVEKCGIDKMMNCHTLFEDALMKSKRYCQSSKEAYKCIRKMESRSCVPDEGLKNGVFPLVCEWQYGYLSGECNIDMDSAFIAKVLRYRTPLIARIVKTGFIDMAFGDKKKPPFIRSKGENPKGNSSIWQCYREFAFIEQKKEGDYCKNVRNLETCVEDAHDLKNPLSRSFNAVTHVVAEYCRQQFERKDGTCKIPRYDKIIINQTNIKMTKDDMKDSVKEEDIKDSTEPRKEEL